MYNLFKLTFYFSVFLQTSDCQINSNVKIDSTRIELQVNYSVINEKGLNEKKILKNWEDYLNSGTYDFYNNYSLSFWKVDKEFYYPNYYMVTIGKNTNEIKNVNKTTPQVIVLYPVSKDTYELKTLFYYYEKIPKKLFLDNIYTVYAVIKDSSFVFLSKPQIYIDKWQNNIVGNIRFCYPSEHRFNIILAQKLDSFNTQLASLFKTNPVKLKYFLCNSSSKARELMGYDFAPEQYVPNQYGAYCDLANFSIFAGNGTEYYPHEVIHFYTKKFWGNDGFYYHPWINEGIAALFGGSRGLPLEWHLVKLKTYLEGHPEEKLDDISKLNTVPNGEFTTEFIYAIGGLICKRVYEKKGMEGLFELLKSGNSDEDFLLMVQKQFGIEKKDFGNFIRNELKKEK